MPGLQSFRARSELIKEVLACSWRAPPLPLEISGSELSEVAPLLLGSGAAGLGWWRVRVSNLQASQASAELQDAYRFHTIRAAYYEQQLKQVFGLMRSEAIEPVLVKGWSISRLYPARGLRPYGDIDLCVPAGRHEKARALLESPECRDCHVDLHDGFQRLDQRKQDALFARSQLASLGQAEIRVPAPEDLLRIICVHLLRHGGWRPLWLCDVALLVESIDSSFDWDRCLSLEPRQSDWVASAIGLARHLLQADVQHTPVARRAERLPGWLVRSVLKRWENPSLFANSPMKHRAAMADHLSHPQGLVKDVLRRWPGPVEATIHMNARFNRMPRWPFQVGHSLTRAFKFIARLSSAFV